MSKNSVVVTLSGGMDSAVLLYDLLERGLLVRALSVNYQQRHLKELACAEQLCKELGVEHFVADLSRLAPIFAGSSQTSPEVSVPEGHYAEETMKATVVPNRNMVLLSLATAWAVSTKSDLVAYAAHAGDHTIYPDCRPEFGRAMSEAVLLCDWHMVRLLTPYLSSRKQDLVLLGRRLGVPFHRTWSCYKGGDKHCGKCGTCVERREAFSLAGVQDPTDYE